MRNFSHHIKKYGNQGSVISAASHYRLDGSVFIPGGARYFLFGLNQAGPGAISTSCAVGTGPFTWSGPVMPLTTHPHLAPTFRLGKANLFFFFFSLSLSLSVPSWHVTERSLL